MPPPQPTPIRIEAPSATPSNAATFIFLHGYGDDAHGWTDIAHQFHTAHKLPHLTWLFPTAPYNPASGTTAWFSPGTFSALPVGRSTNPASNAEPEDWEAEEDQAGILESLAYVQGLVDQEVARGVRPSRIVVGGFSQGCVVSLLLGLGGRYAGRVGGVVGLSGALCSGGTIERAKGEEAWRKGEMGGDGGRVKGGEGRADKTKMRTAFFLAHGTKDFLIPMRFYRKTKERLGRLLGEGTDGVGDGRLECHDYEGMGHGTCGQEFLDLCGFLERVVPA